MSIINGVCDSCGSNCFGYICRCGEMRCACDKDTCPTCQQHDEYEEQQQRYEAEQAERADFEDEMDRKYRR